MTPDPPGARWSYHVERKPFPPLWADFVLRRLVLTRQSRDAVSGDLVEEYRAVIVPERGLRGADRWYVAQVARYIVRSNLVWAALFAAAYLARLAYDWFVPTTDFHVRAEVTTYTAVSLLLGTGFWAAWRSGSMLAGVLAGIATTVIAALISIAGSALLLAGWHDPATLAMIRNSGGIEEVFVLPIFAIGLGLVLGTIGGAAGASARKIRRITVG
jgi:hypothetical protein